MTAGIVESIRFIREPGECELPGARHDKWIIQWSDSNGTHSNHTYWCDHPCCDMSDQQWHLMRHLMTVKLTAWILGYGCHLVAYYLIEQPINNHDDSPFPYLPRMVARIGIGSQWEDPIFGNLSPVNGERSLFTQRYFAIEGPGVYPAEIETRQPCCSE